MKSEWQNQKTHLPDGADSPPFRAEGLEGNAGGGTLLDHHHRAGAGGLEYIENPLSGFQVALSGSRGTT